MASFLVIDGGSLVESHHSWSPGTRGVATIEHPLSMCSSPSKHFSLGMTSDPKLLRHLSPTPSKSKFHSHALPPLNITVMDYRILVH